MTVPGLYLLCQAGASPCQAGFLGMPVRLWPRATAASHEGQAANAVRDVPGGGCQPGRMGVWGESIPAPPLIWDNSEERVLSCLPHTPAASSSGCPQ